MSRTTQNAPRRCLKARLPKKAAEWIRKYSGSFDLPDWIVSGILAQAGCDAIRRPEGPAQIGRNPNSCLWSCINRTHGEADDSILAFIVEGELLQMTDDARELNREVEEWVGTLIDLGIQIYTGQNRGAKFSWLVEDRAIGHLGREAELEILKGRRAVQ